MALMSSSSVIMLESGADDTTLRRNTRCIPRHKQIKDLEYTLLVFLPNTKVMVLLYELRKTKIALRVITIITAPT